jgi:cell division protease FtsH
VANRRPPRPTVERIQRIGIALLLAVGLEQADPLPWLKSPFAWAVYLYIVFEIAKQFWRFRLENSDEAVMRAEAYKKAWETKRDKVDPNVRYRIRRALIGISAFYVYGSIIGMFTDRCEGGFQCGLLSFSLIIEQIPMFLQIALSIAFGLMQMFFMFYAMTKVGFLKVIPPGTVTITFDDIFGQDRARDRIKEQVSLLESDTAVTAAGGYMPKGLLLTGPPGTGKTMLAKAAANASTKPLILIPPGGFASTFIGINFLKVHSLGRTIRKLSRRHGGVIVFFDEIDSLGNRGGEVDGVEPWFESHGEWAIPDCCYSEPTHHPVVVTGGGGMNMGTLEAFLAMMDGMEEPRGLVNKLLSLAGFKPLPPPKVRPFYLGATNRPTVVDPALKRAGRFGSEVRVDYPKFEGRLATYTGYLGKVTHGLEPENIEWLARNHYRGTGAEIQDIVNEALLITFRDGREDPGTPKFKDFANAMLWKRFGESSGVFENPKNIEAVAVHEAGHALVMHSLLKERVRIWFTSIEGRGRTGGMVARSPLDDDFMQSHEEMIANIAVTLASRVAEDIVLGQPSNGHGGDGPAATQAAENMVLLGHTYGRDENDEPYGQISFSSERDPEAFHRAREVVLGKALRLAEEILTEHEQALLDLAHALIQTPTMLGDDVHALLDARGV